MTVSPASPQEVGPVCQVSHWSATEIKAYSAITSQDSHRFSEDMVPVCHLLRVTKGLMAFSVQPIDNVDKLRILVENEAKFWELFPSCSIDMKSCIKSYILDYIIYCLYTYIIIYRCIKPKKRCVSGNLTLPTTIGWTYIFYGHNWRGFGFWSHFVTEALLS